MATPDQLLQYEGPPRQLLLDRGTRQWVQLRTFRFDSQADDAALLDALVADRAYRVCLWDGQELGDESILPSSTHGPGPLSRIHGALFEPVDAATADGALFVWANDQDWNPPYSGQSSETMGRLRDEVCELFERGNVYRLSGLTERDYEQDTPIGWLGFIELVVIDREAEELHLVVAADD